MKMDFQHFPALQRREASRDRFALLVANAVNKRPARWVWTGSHPNIDSAAGQMSQLDRQIAFFGGSFGWNNGAVCGAFHATNDEEFIADKPGESGINLSASANRKDNLIWTAHPDEPDIMRGMENRG